MQLGADDDLNVEVQMIARGAREHDPAEGDDAEQDVDAFSHVLTEQRDRRAAAARRRFGRRRGPDRDMPVVIVA